jgi:outer membrane protein TolC
VRPILLFSLTFLLFSVTTEAAELSLIDFLKTAWESGPVHKGEALQTDASDELIGSARGKYLPHVSLDAIDSTGFPASNSDLGVGGLMGSPFRTGPAGGVVVEQTIYDFGRIQSALELAKADKSLSQARLAADKFQFLFSIGQLYLSCARSRTLQQTDEQLMNWARVNLKETGHFTRTGQESIVENSLVRTEVAVLVLELDQLRKYQESLNGQMKLFGGQGCRLLGDSWQASLPDSLRVEEPSVLLAKAQTEISHANYQAARAAQRPSLQLMGSLGDMENSRLVEKQDYGAGVGLVFPVWNGGEDAKREKAYKLQTDYQTENLKAAQLEYAARLKDLRDEYNRDRDELSVLDKDLEKVRDTMKLATRRYRMLQGPLIDVREAFKQLREMELERIRVLGALGGVSLQLGMLKEVE